MFDNVSEMTALVSVIRDIAKCVQDYTASHPSRGGAKRGDWWDRPWEAESERR